ARHGTATATSYGESSDAPACAAQQSQQKLSRTRGSPLWSSCWGIETGSLWQISPRRSGSPTAAAAAQDAPMGAKICTTSATKTIGKNLCKRCRIMNGPPGATLAYNDLRMPTPQARISTLKRKNLLLRDPKTTGRTRDWRSIILPYRVLCCIQ